LEGHLYPAAEQRPSKGAVMTVGVTTQSGERTYHLPPDSDLATASLPRGRAGWLPFFSSPRLHIGLLFAGYLAIILHIFSVQLKLAGSIGFTMDDAWIHAAVARNFVEGLGFGIEPNRPLSVSTSPTWTLATALFYLFFSDPVQGTLALSIVCMLGAITLFYSTVRTLTGRGWIGVVSAAVMMMNPIVIWGLVSGMELPMVIFALSLVLYLHYSFDPSSRVRLYGVPLALAFAAVTRPELFLLIPLALLDTFFHTWSITDRKQFIDAVRRGFIQSGIILCALAPYFIFNRITTGLLFPTTYYAKTRVRGVGFSSALRTGDFDTIWRAAVTVPLQQVQEIGATMFSHNMVGFLLAAVGAVYFTRFFRNEGTKRGWLVLAALCVIPYMMGVSSPDKDLSNHANRYFVIFPPMLALMAGLGIDFLIRHGRHYLIVAVAVTCMLLAPTRTWNRAVRLVAWDVESTERLYRDMPMWVRDNIDPNAVLATNDIGGLAYFAPRKFIDVMGLATPEIWGALQRNYGEKQDLEKMEHYLRANGVQYVILSPRYYPELTKKKDVFEPIMQWSEKYPRGRTISPQIIYRFK